MKKSKYHIVNSWILLFCFVAGQYMVYSHQHKLVKGAKQNYSAVQHPSRSFVTEKCQLCDAMHHYSMDLASQVHFKPVATAKCIYVSPVYNFTSLALILSGGRAPPLTNCYA